MGGDTCSAYPERLKKYGNEGRGNDQDLLVMGRRLSSSLAALTASGPDRSILAPFEDWGGDLQRYSQRKAQIDTWVAQVGDAFERADSGITVAPDTLVVMSASDVDRILAQDPAVQSALQTLRPYLDDHGLGQGQALRDFIAQLQRMSPEQVQEVLGSLTDSQLTLLDELTGPPDPSMAPFPEYVPPDERNTLVTLLLSSADPDTVKRLMTDMPHLEPAYMTDNLIKDYQGFDWSWAPGNGPLWGPTGMPDPLDDINQGDIGDCWYLAGVGAVAEANPDLLKQHIRANPNGTYTVTFFDKGKPVDVTVTADFPHGTKGNSYTWGDAWPGHSDGSEWVQIYEKAYVQFRGGSYANISGGFGDTSIGDLTGVPTTRQDPGDYSLAQIQDKLSKGYAITLGSKRTDAAWWEFWSNPETMDNGHIVTSHEYFIQSVDLTGQPPTITVVNPWGAQGSADHTVKLTEDQLHQYFDEISMGQVANP
jgi:hypothetical protein